MLTLYSQLHALEISKANASSGQLTLLELTSSVRVLLRFSESVLSPEKPLIVLS